MEDECPATRSRTAPAREPGQRKYEPILKEKLVEARKREGILGDLGQDPPPATARAREHVFEKDAALFIGVSMGVKCSGPPRMISSAFLASSGFRSSIARRSLRR